MENEKTGPVNEKIDLAYQEYARIHYNTGIKADIVSALGVIVGSILMAANMTILLRSGGMIAAGVSGLTMLIQKICLFFFDREIPFTPVSLLLNAFPAYLCYRYVGKKFTVFSFISVILVSLLTDFIPNYTITQDRLLIAVYGGIINGIGSGLILRSGACSGGTDFISMYFSVKRGVNSFNAVFICNSVMILISGILFGMDSALYTIIYQFVGTQVVMFIYQRFAKKTLFIVTDNPHDVSDAIMSATHHACTILNSAEGSYSGEQKHVVYAIVGASEIATVRKLIKGTDPKAFINILNSETVSGRFFQRPIS